MAENEEDAGMWGERMYSDIAFVVAVPRLVQVLLEDGAMGWILRAVRSLAAGVPSYREGRGVGALPSPSRYSSLSGP